MANQNIIEKQQVRGTSASIAQYAGKEGQIVFNKDNKRLHVMSGTVGQSTQYLSTAQAATKTQLSAKLDVSTYNSEKTSFATKSQIPDVSTLATKAEVTSGLADKVNTSTYTADKATFALKTEIPDTSGLATKTQLSGYATKTQLGNYATTTALTQGLAGKANTSHTHEIANINGLQTALDAKAATTEVAPKTHTHAISDVTNLQTTLDGKAASSHNHDSTYIKIAGARGNVAGYESLQSQSTALTVTNTTRDGCCITGAVQITVNNGSSGQVWTKTIGITNASATVSLGSSWKWVGGSAPTIAPNGVLVVHWCGTFGIANFVSPS